MSHTVKIGTAQPCLTYCCPSNRKTTLHSLYTVIKPLKIHPLQNDIYIKARGEKVSMMYIAFNPPPSPHPSPTPPPTPMPQEVQAKQKKWKRKKQGWAGGKRIQCYLQCVKFSVTQMLFWFQSTVRQKSNYKNTNGSTAAITKQPQQYNMQADME